MFFCINCGTKNESGNAFCLGCGQPLYRPGKEKKRSKLPWIVAGVTVILAVMIVLALISSEGGRKNTASPTQAPRQSPYSAVLMLVAGKNGRPTSQGSGFIINASGLGATNYHVLRDTTEATAECCGGKRLTVCGVRGFDVEKDLVVFQLCQPDSTRLPEDLPHVVLGDSSGLTVGERVLAVGSPQGLENSVSDGILSAVREYRSTKYLQITAPISHGSSGGPVFDPSGNVIGVATFQFEKGQNLNFAIAVEHLKPLLNQQLNLSLGTFASSFGVSQQVSKTRKNATSSSQTAVSGGFGGVVHNQTAAQSAAFGIVVRDDEGYLSGCMGVKPPLFGSGALFGTVEGNNVRLYVESAIGIISFSGVRNGATISGEYSVAHPNGGTEMGTFTLQRSSSKALPKNFDSANCPTDAEMHD